MYLKIDSFCFSFLFISIVGHCQFSAISNDGKYIAVQISATTNKTEIYIESLVNDWSEKIEGQKIQNFQFSADSKKILFITKEGLHIQKLQEKEENFIPEVVFYQQQNSEKGQWIGCLLKGKDRELVLSTVDNKRQLCYKNVEDYVFDNNGKGVILKQVFSEGNQKNTVLKWLDLLTGQNILVWDSKLQRANCYVTSGIFFDNSNVQILFNVIDENKKSTIWHYYVGNEHANLLITDSILQLETPELHIDSLPIIGFDKTGNFILFFGKEDVIKAPDPKIVKASGDLDLWSYTDPVNMPYQKKFLSNRNYIISYSLARKSLIRIEKNNQVAPIDDEQHSGLFRGSYAHNSTYIRINNANLSKQIPANNYVVVFEWTGDIITSLNVPPFYAASEYSWNKANDISIWLVSINDGTKKLVKRDMRRVSSRLPTYSFSPGGKYFVYFDEDARNYISYEVATGIKRNICQKTNVNFSIAGSYHGAASEKGFPKGIVGWMKNSNDILVYDCYSDIWKLDATAQEPFVNITHSFLKKNNWQIEVYPIITTSTIEGFEKNKDLFFIARNNQTAEYGIISISLNGKTLPQLKLQGQHSFEINKNGYTVLVTTKTNDTPRQFFLSDNEFSKIQALKKLNESITESAIKPSFTRQLIHWKTFTGKTAFGILFKPTSFDLTKKWPVILYYYEDQPLYGYGVYDSGTLPSIPDVLECGYLVFEPDIRYNDTSKTSLEEAYDCVVSGAKCLAKLPFVNSKKMGICGFSFGGSETNYIVSHTAMFAAAFSAAGLSDFVSYFGIEEKDNGGYPAAESGMQPGLIGNVWSNRDNYLDNSPVFQANKVETPILLVANPNDYRVPSSQGIEFFKALRRCGKKVWLLRYTPTGHGLTNDAMIREMQLFDHYLQDKPPPIWMTRGIPARLKGQTLGLEYDTEIKTPGAGVLIDNNKNKN